MNISFLFLVYEALKSLKTLYKAWQSIKMSEIQEKPIKTTSSFFYTV